MFVRAKTAPAAAGGYTWDDTEQVREVPDELGHELVHVAAGAAFAEVLPGDVPASDKPAKATSRRGKAIEE